MLSIENNAQEQQPKKKREPLLLTEVKKSMSVIFCVNLYNRIATVANARHQSFAGAVQMLTGMGLKEYELNRIAGRNKKDIEADYNKRLTEAQAIAARKAQKRKMIAILVIAVLIVYAFSYQIKRMKRGVFIE